MAKREMIIWDGIFSDYEEMAKEMKEDYGEDYPGESDQFWYDYAYETYQHYLDDERDNLNVKVEGEIIIFATLGLWNGPHVGLKRISSSNIKDILVPQCDNSMIKFYCDGYNVCASESHHDGTNQYIYREMKPGKDAKDLLDKLAEGKITNKNAHSYMQRYTKSIAEPVKKVYGW